jgi:hypothetical protein
MLAILFTPFGLITPKHLAYLFFFKSLSFERTYWMLFQKLQKRAIHTKLDSYILATQLYEQDT